MIPTIIRNKYIVLLVFISLDSQQARTQLVPLQYKENKSFTYDQTMDYYRQLDKKYKKAYLFEKGPTDVGKPLHVFIMYGGKNLQKDVLEKRQVPVLLVM